MIRSEKKYGHSPFLISIEGNIGVGKSTFVAKLSERCEDLVVIQEPVSDWQSIDGENILDAFYKDPSRWGYSFEFYALYSRARCTNKSLKLNKNRNVILVTERSISTNYNTFGRVCRDFNQVSEIEWMMYENWYSWFSRKDILLPSSYIYLRATPETCLSRINKRMRVEEIGISIDYLKSLHRYHDLWLYDKGVSKLKNKLSKPLVINVDKDFNNDNNSYEFLVDTAINFINSNCRFRGL
jgi:deoxyadenosine/deoxycytidine kinase